MIYRLMLIFAILCLPSFSLSAEDGGVRSRAEIIVPEGWENLHDRWHLAPAIKVDGRIYVSGILVGSRDGDLKSAYRCAWQQIETVLGAAGASLDDIVDITSFHTELQAHLSDFAVVKDEFIKEPYPAWTGIGVKELALPNGIVEIKVIAHIP